LVSKGNAEAALGFSLQKPKVAPLGPTCLYSSASGAIAATVAIENTPLQSLRAMMKNPEVSSAHGHQLICGMLGQTTLITQLSSGSVLVIATPCAPAQKMAAEALASLRE
jgi:hypothetical protein